MGKKSLQDFWHAFEVFVMDSQKTKAYDISGVYRIRFLCITIIIEDVSIHYFFLSTLTLIQFNSMFIHRNTYDKLSKLL